MTKMDPRQLPKVISVVTKMQTGKKMKNLNQINMLEIIDVEDIN